MADPNLGLFDLLSPYFLAGVDLGSNVHEVLSLLYVDEFHSTWDETSVTAWGTAHIDSVQGLQHATAQGTIWDWHDVHRLTAARTGSTTIPSAVNAIPDLKTLINSFGDQPGTGGAGALLRYQMILIWYNILLRWSLAHR